MLINGSGSLKAVKKGSTFKNYFSSYQLARKKSEFHMSSSHCAVRKEK